MNRPLEDQEARNQIETDLDCSMIVEAAAGTGKTTALLKRIVRVLAEGRAQVEEIVALTFTEKAASEMKLGLRSRLDQARAATEDPTQRQNLEGALTDLEKAHISTIHTFCAELLRERPVEADVDPAFEVMDEAEARRLYSETFGLWLQEKLDDPPEGVRRALRRFSKRGPVEVLRRAGWTLAEWRDFPTAWRRDAFARESQIDSLVEALHAFSDLTCHPKNARDPFYETHGERGA